MAVRVCIPSKKSLQVPSKKLSAMDGSLDLNCSRRVVRSCRLLLLHQVCPCGNDRYGYGDGELCAGSRFGFHVIL